MGEISKRKLYEYYSSQREDKERMYISDPFIEYCQKRRLKKIKSLLDEDINFSREALILDIGCGDGFSTSFIISDISYKYLVGLELAFSKLAKIKERIKNFYGFVGDAECLPFTGNSFDYIFCFETLEHLMNPLRATNEIRRVLKPSGLCIISIPLDSPWQEKIIHMNKAVKRIINKNDDFNEHLQFFPMKRVTALLEESGLKIANSVRVGFKFPFRKTLFRMLGRERIGRLDDWFSEKIPIGAFGYRSLSIGNEFLVLWCNQSKEIS